MKKAELLISIIGIIGIIIKVMLIPGGSILISLSFINLMVIYFFLGFALLNNIEFKNAFKKESFNNIYPLQIIGAILSGWGIGIVIMGISFKAIENTYTYPDSTELWQQVEIEKNNIFHSNSN
jgi:hypothetical protein